MKKNSHNQDIKRRLIALLTIAVFVFVMGFCPVSSVSAADTDEVQVMESQEPVDDADIMGDEQSLEETVEEAIEETTYEPPVKGMGRIDIPQIRDRLSVEKSDEPSYLKKRENKLERALPAVYDSREMEYYKNRVAMLDQGDTGTCWAHSVSTAAQISYLKELFDNSSLGSKNYQLAPLDFAYNFYHRVPYKNYGYTDKDTNNALDKYGNVNNKLWKDNGGNNWLSSIAMANWMGMHAKGKSSYADSNAYNNSLVLENAMYINDIKTTIVSDSGKEYKCNVLNQPLVKQAVQKYGAVSVALWMEDAYRVGNRYYNEDYINYDQLNNLMTSNCDYSDTAPQYINSTNHEVVLIGWDDTFPKENFVKEPENDGAWIIQNSWGSDIEGDGFFYVSYEDLSISSAVALDMQPATKYDANYQYDGSSYADGIKVGVDDQLSNVFTVPDDSKKHSLEGIGFMAWNNYLTKYKIRIYKGVGTVPTSGTLAATFNVQTDTPGNYTFDFNDYGIAPIKLNKGEKFAVVVQSTEANGDDNSLSLGIDCADNWDWIEFKSVGKKNTSFYKEKDTSKWYDLYNEMDASVSLRIKAFTTTVPKKLSNATVTLPQGNYNYTGKRIKPAPTVVYDNQTLVKGEDYTVSYTKNKYPGTAKLTVKGKGLYKGSVTKSFKIAAVQNFQQTGATSSSIKLGWDKSPKVNGYMVYKKISGKFKLVKTIKKNSTIKFTEKKLKANKEYQYKIRTYKKVGKKTYKGPLSPALVVRTAPVPEP